jgi:hypothetical protein
MGKGRAYNVFIEAEDQNGNKVEFTEVAEYPDRSRDRWGCVSEPEREAKAIAQVRNRMPHLRNVRAKWSIHV